MVRSKLLVAILLGWSSLGLSACWPGADDTAGMEETGDTLQMPAPAVADTNPAPDPGTRENPATPDPNAAAGPITTLPDSTPTDSVSQADPGPAAAAITPPPSQEPAGQSLEALNRRLDALETENDSLRIALRTLMQLPAGSLGAGAAADSAGEGSDDLIQVDTTQVRNWGFRTLVAVLFLVATAILVRMLVWVLEKLAERSAKRRLMFKRLVPIVRILVWAIAAMFVVRVVFSVGGQELLAAGAAIGVAVGFAAQDILKNIFGGLIVLFDQPFQVGDKVSVGGTYGEVVTIGLRSTRIVTPDDNLVTVPNAQVVDGQVANANAGELNCQVVTDLYLPGQVNESLAKSIAFEAAASSKYVFLNKPIVVLVKDKFEYTFLTHIKVKAYVLDPRYEFLFMSDVTERARMGFRKAGLLPDSGQPTPRQPGPPSDEADPVEGPAAEAEEAQE